MENPEVNFVNRTLEILNDSKKFKRDMSIIINCTYGLLLFPLSIIEAEKNSEKKKNSNWWKELPPWNEEIVGFPEAFAVVKKNHPKSLGDLLKKVRDGLSHQSFVPNNDNGKFIGIRIVFKRQGGIDGVEKDIDWTFEANQEQLKAFLIFIAGKYLEYYNSPKSEENFE